MLKTPKKAFGQMSEFEEYIPNRSSVQLRERLARLQINNIDVPYNREIRTKFTGKVKVEKIEGDPVIATTSITRPKPKKQERRRRKRKVLKNQRKNP